MRKLITLLLLVFICSAGFAQRTVSITIDDVPNVRLFKADGYSSKLLEQLDSIQLPVAIFINEGNITQNEEVEKNKNLLRRWIEKDFVTVGNHGYSHLNYADVGFDAFSKDVIKGEELTKEFLKGSGKNIEYFRFPFNSLGNDSADYNRIDKFLASKKYISTPYTVESEDWLYAEVYNKALANENFKYAEEVGNRYVEMTFKIFKYFDSLSVASYGRSIAQVYLCHDNKLNTDYLPKLIQKLRDEKYEFISLKKALSDPVYKSKEYYTGKAGFSWMYRWMEDKAKRRTAMIAEPANPEIQKAFEQLTEKK